MLKNLSSEEKIVKERIQLLLKYRFFGYLALSLELQETTELPTMATDGNHLFYNTQFVESLKPEELRAILAHEALHCALGHLWRIGDRDMQKWNYATDFAINLIIEEENTRAERERQMSGKKEDQQCLLKLPSDCLLDKKYKGMPAEKIYTLLPDPKDIPGKMLTSHAKWPKPGSGQSRPTNLPQPPSASGDPVSPEKAKAESQNSEKPEKKDGTGNKDANPAQAKDLKDIWQDRLIKASHEARNHGNLPGAMAGLIEDILEPKLDWKTILRDRLTSMAKNDFRFFPPSKRYVWQDMYLPSLYGERLEIGVGVDASGSVNEEQFQELIAEVRGITEQFEDYLIHIFICDTVIREDEYFVISPHEPWPRSFPKRNGGTDFRPVFDAIAEKDLQISALVYLTDGDGSFPQTEPDYPVIWVLNQEHYVPWGEKIIMEASDR